MTELHPLGRNQIDVMENPVVLQFGRTVNRLENGGPED
jgi:hypothetical protein